ncbi:MAG TPA: protease modulator HflC [Acetobacteraceae bacterium]|nr:protease modulator HflC [Acetobacteraceae bacterium]
MNRVVIAAIALLAVLLIVVDASLFTVDQTQQALITQFGDPVRVVTAPGLHVKTPFVQTVIPFDKRLLTVELPGEEVILGDQRRLIVDSFVVFRIKNPLRYYQAVGTGDFAIQSRMDAIVSGSLRRVLADNTLLNVLSADRDHIMATIRDQVNAEMPAFGVSIEDVRIRRADLPQENTQAILKRMQSERQRVAAEARAQGAEASAKIRANAERERTVLLAQARATADRLRGEGEAGATAIYAKAFNQDPWFFGVWRTLQGYRDAFATGAARLVITPDNAYLRYLQAAPVPPGK